MEEEKFNCDECNREFKSKEALEMHNSSKHSSKKNPKEENTKTSFNSKKIRNWAITIAILGLFFYGIFWSVGSSDVSNTSVTSMNIVSHNNIAMHSHSDLSISINGDEITIPSNIGVSQGVMRPLHTHGSSGEIHIEGPFKRDFTVGEFFQVWGRTFNSTCIFDYCTNTGELKMYVNGAENHEFENYAMRDHDTIRIQYNSLEQDN